MLASEVLATIKMHLSTIYKKANEPESLLAVYRHESQGLHCSLIVYLTNEFQCLAKLDNTRACNTPVLSDSGFLAGNEAYFNHAN